MTARRRCSFWKMARPLFTSTLPRRLFASLRGRCFNFCRTASFCGSGLLGELNLSFDICCPGEKLQDAAKLIVACPDTRFILDHCGNPDVLAKDQTAWKRGIEAVATHPRVICKVSGIVAAAGDKWSVEQLAPIVRHVRESFGPERIMFAAREAGKSATGTGAGGPASRM
jgi:hypothetical protein